MMVTIHRELHRQRAFANGTEARSVPSFQSGITGERSRDFLVTFSCFLVPTTRISQIVPLKKFRPAQTSNMVGRDDCNRYCRGRLNLAVCGFGDDRISTDLHNLIVANNTRKRPKP